MKRALVTLACVAVSAGAYAAQSATAPGSAQPQRTAAPTTLGPTPNIGRLFFTPTERTQLDLARIQKKVPTQSAAAERVEPPSAPQTVTYGGLVRRSDGRQMLWINNRLVDEKEALAGLNLKGKIRPDGAVTLQAQSGASVDIKVGQSVELQTGKVGETRKPPPEPKPAADRPPDEDVKGAAEGKGPAEAKGQGPEPKPGTTAAKPPAPEGAEKKTGPGGMGLKMDLGGRALSSEEAERLSRGGK